MTFFPVILLLLAALGVAWGGSFWIDRLYDRNRPILTFPDATASRSRWRKPLLGLGFFGCGFRLLQMTSGLPLVLMLVFTAFLLWMTATDFEQYCLFDAMMLPFALSALVMLLAGQKNRKSSFAYGPYFMLTALALMLVRGL